MAAIAILYLRRNARIGSVELDASISETHTSGVEVTNHPVERGSVISDHARVQPDEITIEGFITNTPLPSSSALTRRTNLGVEFDSGSEAELSRAGQGYADLVALKNAGELVSVVTMLRTYDDMLLTSLTVPRDATTGDGLRFSASLKQVRVVASQTVQATTAEDKTAPKKAQGKKAAPKTPPPAKAQAQSAAYSAAQALGLLP